MTKSSSRLRRAVATPTGMAAALVIVKHRENIRRLLAGTENRFGTRGAK